MISGFIFTFLIVGCISTGPNSGTVIDSSKTMNGKEIMAEIKDAKDAASLSGTKAKLEDAGPMKHEKGTLPEGQGTLADYLRAEQAMDWNVRKLVFEAEVIPHWIGETDRFWYRNEKPGKREFILMDPDANTSALAFDHARLAAALSTATGKSYSEDALPFETFEFTKDEAAIRFEAAGERWKCSLDDYICRKDDTPVPDPNSCVSPDGKWIAEVKQYNLYVRSAAAGEEIQLTHDGLKYWAYATPLPSSRLMVEQRTEDPRVPPAVFWSPDSKKLVTYRIDSRNAGKFTITQNAPDFQLRPVAYNVVYPLPGEEVSKAEPLVFEIETGKRIAFHMDPLEILYYGGPEFRWLQDNIHFTFDFTERGFQRLELREADSDTGEVRALIQDRSDTFVNGRVWFQRWLNHESEILATSERDDWNHLYLYDVKSAKLKNQVTRGEFVVRSISAIDDSERQVYFLAGGREPGRDPYLTHLYRINLDGTGLELLTPEDSNHTVSFSPSKKFFVDVYSRPGVPPVSVLRRADGAEVRVLERANVERLLETGFQYPEPFQGKGRDGVTDIYGIVWRPAHLDPSRKYPVIEQIYTGPQGFSVPKTFAAYYNDAQAIAELGFVVVQIDGLGTPGRSKAFHGHCYRNLGDGGVPDHIAVMKQMAAKYPYMDLTRVGVYGTSAGGYDSVRVMLTHPDFYRVAVSTSGLHDHRMDKSVWIEQWMGDLVGEWYDQQSNVKLAGNLQGRLLLIHGDLDENVNVSNTLQLANALIRANKDFDMYIVPNMFHGDSDIMWVGRKRWDYFVQHLLGVTPPKGFELHHP
jgi:dipeptidyl aminopeptidase/acylaminoacyl peptidase